MILRMITNGLNCFHDGKWNIRKKEKSHFYRHWGVNCWILVFFGWTLGAEHSYLEQYLFLHGFQIFCMILTFFLLNQFKKDNTIIQYSNIYIPNIALNNSLQYISL